MWPSFRAALLALVAVGLAARVLRYGLCFPIWGDEAMLALHFREHGFRDIARALANGPHGQLAPALFLWIELAVCRLFGSGELALRLWSILAGCGGLPLLVILVRKLSGRVAAVFAVGMVAVGNFPIRHAAEVKPYASDLLFSVALLLPAAMFLRNPRRVAWLMALAAIAPVALLGSFPAVFVAGGVSVGLLPVVWRAGGVRRWALYVLYNAAMIGGFIAAYRLAVSSQYAAIGAPMLHMWQENFPPSTPWALTKWLVLMHTGMMFALPFGGANGASAATTLLVLLGVRRLWRQRQWPLLLMLLMPFALSLVAAFLHRYPYGASARLCQYLVPSICLLGGLGAARLVSWVRRYGPSWLQRGLVPAWIAVLLLFGLGMMVHDVYRPGQTPADIVDRRVIQGVFRRAGAREHVVVLNSWGQLQAQEQWYFLQETRGYECGGESHLTLTHAYGKPGTPGLWFMARRDCQPPLEPAEVQQMFAALDGSYTLVGQAEGEVNRLPSDSRHKPDSYWQVFHFVARRGG